MPKMIREHIQRDEVELYTLYIGNFKFEHLTMQECIDILNNTEAEKDD